MNVNVWDVAEPIQALVAGGRQIDERRLADADVPLTFLLDGVVERVIS
jgi:3-phenylpropionate/trans-cinnamate dioxygenase ferredoxin reductase subunit